MWDSQVEQHKYSENKVLEEINKSKADKITKECGFELKKVRYRDFL